MYNLGNWGTESLSHFPKVFQSRFKSMQCGSRAHALNPALWENITNPEISHKGSTLEFYSLCLTLKSYSGLLLPNSIISMIWKFKFWKGPCRTCCLMVLNLFWFIDLSEILLKGIKFVLWKMYIHAWWHSNRHTHNFA